MNRNLPYTTETVLSTLAEFMRNRQEHYGVETLALYGSYARHEQTKDSDIDIAVKLKQPNLLQFISLENELQDLFDVKVDVISLSSKFLPGFAEQIQKDMIYITNEY